MTKYIKSYLATLLLTMTMCFGANATDTLNIDSNGNVVNPNPTINFPNGLNVGGNQTMTNFGSLPEVWVLANNVVRLSDGTLTNYPNSLTAGIQEALNTLPRAIDYQTVGGGKISLVTYIYKTATNIISPFTTNAFSLTIVGSGINSTVILSTNNIPNPVLTVSGQGANSTTLFVQNLMIASVTNATTNLVLVGKGSVSFTLLGGVARAKFDNVCFGWWGGLTNWSKSFGGLTPDVGGDGAQKHNLVVRVDNNFGDDITFIGCSFDYINCLSIANPHNTLISNGFEGCGGPNDWPSSSPYYAGYSVVFLDPIGGFANTPTENKIIGNFFVNGVGPDYLFYYVDAGPVYIYDCDYETANATCATATTKVFFINPKDNVVNDFYDITNADFSKPFQVDTGLVQVASIGAGYSQLKFNATNTLNKFTANFVSTTHLVVQKTNVAPSNVTIGTTTPDLWITITNNGLFYTVPVWNNH